MCDLVPEEQQGVLHVHVLNERTADTVVCKTVLDRYDTTENTDPAMKMSTNLVALPAALSKDYLHSVNTRLGLNL